MKFDARAGDSGVVLDATGAVIAAPVRGDTQTGWVEVIEWRDGMPAYVERRYAPPLRIEPLPRNYRFADDPRPRAREVLL